MTLAIETEALVKHFGKTKAVEGVDLQVKKGTVYGLLGPNGAGKTTIIRVLTTLLRPTSGSARVLGLDVVREARTVRAKVGLTGQFASVDEDLSGHENLVLVGRLLGLPWGGARERAAELLGAFGLADASKRLVKTYSGGMRRRLDIGASLVATPEVLFLDEPTSGLDPRGRNQVWDIIRNIAREGTTVLLTTQYLDEADRLAERMAVIDHGKLIAEGTSVDLKASVGTNRLHIRLRDARDRPRAEGLLVSSIGAVESNGAEPANITANVSGEKAATDALYELSRAGIGVAQFSLGNPTLDEVFLALTGKPAEDPEEEGAAK